MLQIHVQWVIGKVSSHSPDGPATYKFVSRNQSTTSKGNSEGAGRLPGSGGREDYANASVSENGGLWTLADVLAE